jgi:hypothetical protein
MLETADRHIAPVYFKTISLEIHFILSPKLQLSRNPTMEIIKQLKFGLVDDNMYP